MKKVAQFAIPLFVLGLCACSQTVGPSSADNDSNEAEQSFSGIQSDNLSSSSKKGADSSSSSEDLIDNNSFVDKRDGKVYKTVKIGDQVWMAENLNYAYTDIPYNDEWSSSDSTSWCLDNDPANCTKYGRLYTWAAAMDSVTTGCGSRSLCSPTLPVRGMCPTGWHLPSKVEWESLLTAVGGQSNAGVVLRSKTGWNKSSVNGTDAFGFSALPAGERYGGGNFDFEGKYAIFWSSTDSAGGGGDACYMSLAYYDKSAFIYDYSSKKIAHSVRCLKDE